MDSVYWLLFESSPNIRHCQVFKTVLSQQRNSPVCNLRHKASSPWSQPSIHFIFSILCFCFLWKGCQLDKIKVEDSLEIVQVFSLPSTGSLLLQHLFIFFLSSKIFWLQRKYLQESLLEYPNIIYCIDFCFHELCLHGHIGNN